MNDDRGRQLDEVQTLRRQVARLTHQLDQATAELHSRPVLWDQRTPKRSASWWTGPTLEQVVDQVLAVSGPVGYPITDDETRARWNEGVVHARRTIIDAFRVNDSDELMCPWCSAREPDPARFLRHLSVEFSLELRRRQRGGIVAI